MRREPRGALWRPSGLRATLAFADAAGAAGAGSLALRLPFLWVPLTGDEAGYAHVASRLALTLVPCVIDPNSLLSRATWWCILLVCLLGAGDRYSCHLSRAPPQVLTGHISS